MHRPLISVILPVYNEPRLSIAIWSILRQDLEDFELIVIDDGSDCKYLPPQAFSELTVDDGSDCIYLLPPDRRIRFFRQPHQHIAAAINHGLEKARGVVIARQDADDISDPRRLRRQLEFLLETGYDACSCQWDYLDDVEHPPSWPLPTDPKEIARRLKRCNCLGGGYWMARRSVIDAVGPQTWDYPYCEDWEWWLRFHKKGFRVGVVDEILYHIYYKHAQRPPEYILTQMYAGERLKGDYEIAF